MTFWSLSQNTSQVAIPCTLGKRSPKSSMCYEHPIYGAACCIAKIHRSKNQRRKQKWHHLLAHKQKFLFYHYHNVVLASDVQQRFRYKHVIPPPTHIHTYSFLLWFIRGRWIHFLLLYSRTLLFMHVIHSRLNLLSASASFICPHSPPPFSDHRFVFCICESVSVS